MPAKGQLKPVPEIIDRVRELAMVGCTDDEIGLILHMDDNTVLRRFGPLIKEGRANLRQSIRHMQIQRAREGSDTMLVWLGKVMLHQKEKSEVTIDATDTLSAFIHEIRGAPAAGRQQVEIEAL
jgi:hypothetical protein